MGRPKGAQCGVETDFFKAAKRQLDIQRRACVKLTDHLNRYREAEAFIKQDLDNLKQLGMSFAQIRDAIGADGKTAKLLKSFSRPGPGTRTGETDKPAENDSPADENRANPWE